MAAFAGDEVNDKPDSAGEEFAHDQSQEECPELHVGSNSAVSQDDGLEEPADKYGEPELDHGPATAHSVSDGMERPPEELGAHEGDEDHENEAQSSKQQPCRVRGLRVEKHITEPAEGQLRSADKEPLAEVRSAVFVADDQDGYVGKRHRNGY